MENPVRIDIDTVVVSLQVGIPHHATHKIGVLFEVDLVNESILVIQAFDSIDGMSPVYPGYSNVESHHKEIEIAPVKVVKAVVCTDAEAVTASPRVLEGNVTCCKTCAF